ncbi:TPA: hypothetical protein RJN57_000516 [Pseudomonas aeruginosa]|nr:hypothetical protein [Pseudomonas aeruginosa]HDV6123012.1 hypothetical protein [Pseudomonas aeruginosa]HDV6143890.1 hypothetical protein [Pseudomonas aeruginosa]HDV6168462.1 hypothetical protein [Pseudomonas aeruginosa]
MIDQVVHKLHLWTDGDSNSGRTGETAEVSAPGWLLSSEAYDPEEFMVVLEAFREKAREAFEVIWPNEIVFAKYDFELRIENEALAGDQLEDSPTPP